jgi:hypothetical protein
MVELLDFIAWESFTREVASNICTNILVNCLEGNLETNMVHKNLQRKLGNNTQGQKWYKNNAKQSWMCN